ncbi:hypothetical protein KJA14_00995 [Patescibacteria group bacterium]|nr:hypothetical protein [Patescibacteria group bacterium]
MKFKSPFLKKTTTPPPPSRFWRAPKPECFLALDIGTETVKTLIFKNENKKLIILGSALQYFEQFGVFDTKDFEEEILKKAISKVIEEIQKKTKVKTDTLFLGLPANVLRGRVVSQNFKRKNQKKIISEIEKNQIYKEVSDSVKEKLSQEFAREVGLLPEDFFFSNLKILEIKIDGYEVPSLQGLNGKNLDFRVLTVFLSKYYLKKIKKICQDLDLKISKTVHQIENLPLLFQKKKINAIFLDIGGQFSNIFLMEKGKPKGISEFKKGGVDFTRKLSQVLGLSFQDARVLKHNYSQLLLSEKTRKKVREIFSDNVQDWFKNFKKTLKKFSKKLLPSNIFLFGGGSLLPEIPEILEKGDWTDFPFVFKPKVSLVYPKDLKNIGDKTQGLNSPQEIPLLLISYD